MERAGGYVPPFDVINDMNMKERQTLDYARGKRIWGNGLCVDQFFYRYLVDGDSSTMWKSRYPFLQPQHIVLDLEHICVIDRLVIKEPLKKFGRLKRFTVSCSRDGESWKKINIREVRDTSGVIICDFEEEEVRLLRFEMTDFDTTNLSLVALEVYHTTDTKPILVPELPSQHLYRSEILRSKIVYEENGILQYRPYDEDGNCIPDFSNVGYKNGVAISEDIPIRIILEPNVSTKWDTERIQEAIDQVSNLPIGENGYRGAVLLKKGRYSINRTISMHTSGVVLMGEGDGEQDTVIYADFGKKIPIISIEGIDDMTEITGSRKRILEDFIPVGSHSFTLEDATGYQVGDDVVLHIKKNQNWVDTLQMGKEFLHESNGKKPWEPEFYQYHYESKVTAVSGNYITLDQPVVDSCDRRYGDYELYRYRFDGRVRNCGVRDIRVVSAYCSEKTQEHDVFGMFFSDDEHADIGVFLDKAEECWVKNFTTVHLANQCVCIWKKAKRVTVEMCKFLQPVSTLVGGNRYAFSVNGQQNLVRYCFSECGRHDFVTGGRTPGPNVFFTCIAENSYQNSENHHRWGTATLYDNVSVSGPNTYLSSGNRGDCGTGHGWSGANMVFWNCTSPIIAVQKPPLAQNFAIGVSDILDHKENKRAVLDAIDWYNQQGRTNIPYDGNTIWGDGYKEALTNTVTPKSLYLKQLEDRGIKKGDGHETAMD